MMAVFEKLLAAYGRQGWWPIRGAGRGRIKTDAKGYHPGDFSPPVDAIERFQVMAGAVLTQNTAWKNVEKALQSMVSLDLLSPGAIAKAKPEILAEAIRSSGYYNEKTKKLIRLAEACLRGGWLEKKTPPRREELLSVWGIGEETADSILLYACDVPSFVVDAYTKRIFSRLGLVPEEARYAEVQELFHSHLAPEVPLFNEYHALIVAHGKSRCRKIPDCSGCALKRLCRFTINKRSPA